MVIGIDYLRLLPLELVVMIVSKGGDGSWLRKECGSHNTMDDFRGHFDNFKNCTN